MKQNNEIEDRENGRHADATVAGPTSVSVLMTSRRRQQQQQ